MANPIKSILDETHSQITERDTRIKKLENELKQEKYLTQFYKSWAIEAGIPPVEPAPMAAGI